MANINDPIPYNWTFGWEGVSEESPIVTPLLKAIIECNIPEMNRLSKQGALLNKCDNTTLRRIIFHVADSFPVMEWLVKHGVSRIGNDIDYNGNNGINDETCISPSGHGWGLSARAYYLKAYDVMDLLCSHGFSELGYYDDEYENTQYADEKILSTGDEKGLKILLENGYDFKSYSQDRYYEKYVLCRQQVKRKTIGLDGRRFSTGIPAPKYEKIPLFFGKKDAELRNKRRQEDYEDRIYMYNKFITSFGQDKYKKLLKEHGGRCIT